MAAISPPGADEVHVWWIALERMEEHAVTVLSPDERARSDRFHFPRDRARWIGARAALRQILASYTGSSPENLRFNQISGDPSPARQPPRRIRPSPIAMGEGSGVRANRWAKPALADESPLRFSLSHSGDRAALAVAWEREVGIDLEALDPALDLRPLVAVACTSAEAARLGALPVVERVEAFLTLWTLKEAYLKAMGAGLSRDPRTIAVVPLPNGRAAVDDTDRETDYQCWSLCRLDAGPGWVAALAVAGAEPTVSHFHWPLRR